MQTTARQTLRAALAVSPKLAKAVLAGSPKPGTSAWLRAQQEARKAREAAELAAYAAGGTQEDAAQAARKAAGRDCEFPGGCADEAIWEGLLQVANPSAENPEGIQRNVRVCNHHSARWSALWGCWPLAGNERATEIAEAHEADRRRAEETIEGGAFRKGDVVAASVTEAEEGDGWRVLATYRDHETGQDMARIEKIGDEDTELDVELASLRLI